MATTAHCWRRHNVGSRVKLVSFAYKVFCRYYDDSIEKGGHPLMDFITRMFVKAHNWHRGQTMTEYALILSAVAVVVYIGYQTMGTSITSLLTTTDTNL
jgi:Flp pilus assembly pilin Flp